DTGKKAGSQTGFPMAVLVNGYTASGSEMVAACLQDHKRAIIVGERTYGKGCIQRLEEFSPTGGQFQLTISRFFPPSGRNIDKLATGGTPDDEWGVKPDVGYDLVLPREEQAALEKYLIGLEVIGRKEVKPFE